MPEEKTCARCGFTGEVDEHFGRQADYRHREVKYYARSYCRPCQSKRLKEWTWKNPEKADAIRRRYDEKHPGKSTARAREWGKNNRERVRERQNTNYRIRKELKNVRERNARDGQCGDSGADASVA